MNVMPKIIRVLIVLLAMAGTHAQAKSKQVPKPVAPPVHNHLERFHEEGGMTVYIDERDQKVLSDGMMVWKVWNYHAPKDHEGYIYQSERVQTQYDCKHRKIRLIMWVAHAGPMGTGDIVQAGIDPKEGWEDISAGTLGEMEWNHFCPPSRQTSRLPSGH